MPYTFENKHVFKAQKEQDVLICWSRSFEPRRAIWTEIIGWCKRREGPPIWRTPTPARKRVRFRKPPKYCLWSIWRADGLPKFLCLHPQWEPAGTSIYRFDKKRSSIVSANLVRFEFHRSPLDGHPNDIRVTARKNIIRILSLYSFFDQLNIERSGETSRSLFARRLFDCGRVGFRLMY